MLLDHFIDLFSTTVQSHLPLIWTFTGKIFATHSIFSQNAIYFATNGFELRPLVLGPEDPNFRKDNRDLILKRKQQHDMWVQKTCPKEKLLTYRIGEGWEPICKFLNKPGIVFESTYDIFVKNFRRNFARNFFSKLF